MSPYLEHANINVVDIDGTARFLMAAFPEFRIRQDGVNTNGGRWMHIGTDRSYLALNQLSSNRGDNPPPDRLNHLGFVVEDADAVRQRLLDAGYHEGLVTPDHQFRKRRYMFDSSWQEWEFVEYLSDDPAERNSYID